MSLPVGWIATQPLMGGWAERGACVGANPDDFDPDLRELPELKQAAVRYCQGCPVRAECADYGISNTQFGVWGGYRIKDQKPLLLLPPVPAAVRRPIGPARPLRGASREAPEVLAWRSALSTEDVRKWHARYVMTAKEERSAWMRAGEREYQRRRDRRNKPARSVPQSGGAA